MYDIIGDIHGQASLLRDLLERMNYSLKDGAYHHPKRKAIFVGDFINRGPEIRETLQIIKAMHEQGSALVILGNHEIYALMYCLRDKLGKRISNGTSASRKASLEATLYEFKEHQEEWKLYVKWMRSLPLYLDLGKIRVVHACWDSKHIQLLEPYTKEDKIKKSFLKQMVENNSPLATAFWEVCKGKCLSLPKGQFIYDNKGIKRNNFRVRWWEVSKAKDFHSLSYDFRFNLPKIDIPLGIQAEREAYPANAPIVFFGHYCIRETKNILAPNVCCLDNCVRRTGKLTAYRWKGEEQLNKKHLMH